MINLNPKAILYLSKLSRKVLEARGVRYSISEERGILELLKYVESNKDVAYLSHYADFLKSLSEGELQAFKSLREPVNTELPSGIEKSQAAGDCSGSVEMKTVIYRGVKKKVPINDIKPS